MIGRSAPPFGKIPIRLSSVSSCCNGRRRKLTSPGKPSYEEDLTKKKLSALCKIKADDIVRTPLVVHLGLLCVPFSQPEFLRIPRIRNLEAKCGRSLLRLQPHKKASFEALLYKQLPLREVR